MILNHRSALLNEIPCADLSAAKVAMNEATIDRVHTVPVRCLFFHENISTAEVLKNEITAVCTYTTQNKVSLLPRDSLNGISSLQRIHTQWHVFRLTANETHSCVRISLAQ